MTYELAKQLKDAGFPQEGNGVWYPDNPNGEGDACYAPTLSELIVACGDGIVGLTRMWEGKWLKGWGAMYTRYPMDSFHSIIEGNTPEEAVAKLWLESRKSS
jgi:hypothetical protein